MKERLTLLAQRILRPAARRSFVRLTRWPPVGWVRFGSLRRLKPIDQVWGFKRGQPVDRYYIERFLADHAEDIRGHVLEIGMDTYTRRFGRERVTRSDILHVTEDRPPVTLIGDLTNAKNIPSDTFDCVILTQTLQYIFEVSAAVGTIFRILKPRGVVLATVPGISNISRHDVDRWRYYWNFTTKSARRLFETAFSAEHIQVEAHGNVLVAVAFLHGLASEELREKELNYHDPHYEVLVTIRAGKPATPQ